MNEENSSLAFELKARILPTLEGADQLIQQVQQLPQSISTRMQQTTQSAAFQEGLTPQQIKKVEAFAGMTDVYEFQKFQEKQKELLEDLDVDLSSGKLSRSTQGKWLKKFQRQGGMIEGFAEDLSEQLNEPYFDFLGPDKKKMLMSALSEGTREATDNVEKLNREFGKVADSINRSSNEARNLFDQMKSAGLLTMAGVAVDAGMNYWLQGKRIEAAERTSFSFGSPMGMFFEQQKFELYKRTSERTRLAEITGGIGGAAIGGIGALALGATGIGLPAAIVGGYFFGSSLLSKFAEGENITDTAEVQERLKRRGQVFEQLNGMVNQSSSYDILRARTRARIGTEAIEGSSDLGYSPTEELQMRNTFVDARNKYLPQLYKEQTTFARAEGVDPNAIYNLNLSARMTGMDIGISGLDKARQIATATYGENVSSQRIVDILNDLKNLNEKLLETNVSMDSRDALRMSAVPNMVFGNDSSYGRLSEKGIDTLNIIKRFGQGGSLAQEAWLFNAYGVKNPIEFVERQRRGALDPENFEAITRGIRRTSGGNKYMARILAEGLLDWDKNIPANFMPDLVDFMIEGEEPTKENLDKKVAELQKKYGRNLDSYKTDAAGAVSDTEKNRAAQQTIINEIGDDYRKVINKMGLDWLHTWSELSTPMSNRIILENQLNDVLGESVRRFKEFFLDGGKTSEEFSEWKKKDERERRMFMPEDPDSNRTTEKSLHQLEDKFKLDHSDSYNDWKRRQDSGWWRNTEKKLEDYVGHSAVSKLYEIKTREGYDPTGKNHAPNSPHYRGDALDIDVYKKTTGERIPKAAMGNYSDLMETFEGFAKSNRTVWGGDWNNKDVNHFEKQSNNPQPHIDYRELASAIKEALQDHQGKEIIIRDQTAGGITSEQAESVNRHANSVFGGAHQY